MRVALLGLLAFSCLAGCGSDDEGGGQDASATGPGNGEPTVFVPGIYYRLPDVNQPAARLAGPGAAAADEPLLPPVGFDIQDDLVVAPEGDSRLVVYSADGRERSVTLQGLHHVGRPTLSPDGGRVAIQATDYAPLCGCPTDDFNIYVADLADGTWHRLGDLSYNEESPEWIPGSNEVAYSSFSPSEGVDLHVRDATTGAERLRVDDAGGIHLAASKDGSRILEPARGLVRDLSDGHLVTDLRDEALAGLRAAGYDTDPGHAGQGNRGTFPLDADWSPDGKSIVFDGLVKGPTSGLLLFTLGAEGTGFTLHAGPLPANPDFSNGHNFSLTNPHWIG